MPGPYKTEKRSGYWLLVDTRNGQPASYPTTERNCKDEERQMNDLYEELLAEEEPEDHRDAALDRQGYSF